MSREEGDAAALAEHLDARGPGAERAIVAIADKAEAAEGGEALPVARGQRDQDQVRGQQGHGEEQRPARVDAVCEPGRGRDGHEIARGAPKSMAPSPASWNCRACLLSGMRVARGVSLMPVSTKKTKSTAWQPERVVPDP